MTRASVTGSSALVASSRIRIGGSFEERAGDGEPLALAAGEEPAAFADAGVETFRVALDEFQRLGALGGVAHFGDCGVGLADAQILGDRAVEQQRLLKHHADIAAQPGERQRPDVHAVDGDEARLRVEGAVQERERGGFAAAGRADQSDAVAGQRGEAQIRDGCALAVIGERHVAKFDQPAHATGVDRVDPVAHRRHGVEHGEELDQLRRIHEQAVGEADHLLEPRDQ